MEPVQEESHHDIGQETEEQGGLVDRTREASNVCLDSDAKNRDDSTNKPPAPIGQISPAPSLLIVTPYQSTFAQMEAFLMLQQDKCTFYKTILEDQGHSTMRSKFETYLSLTQKDLEVLRKSWNEAGKVPKFKFETVRITCTPTNVDIKDKELHVIVRTSNLPVAENALIYAIGEFEFPLTGKGETFSQMVNRCTSNISIDINNLFCCRTKDSRQLDMVYSTNVKPFFDTASEQTEYTRALQFFVEKGRSRTLKRKFKPVKITFYEKTNFFRCDKKIGTALVKVDSINDDASLNMRIPIMNGRKQTNALVDIRVRVREPLVDKSLKTHEEKILFLT